MLFFLVLLEVIAHDILLKHLHPKAASWLYLASGLLIGAVILYPTKTRGFPLPQTIKSKLPKYLFPAGVILLFLIGVPHVSALYSEHPLDYKIADMLPIMQIMTERFMSGENPYKIIPEIWGGMQPIYLPAMWLPFIPAYLCHIDMRWITYIMIALGCLSLSLIKSRGTVEIKSASVIALIPLAIILYSMIKVNIGLLVLTEEGIVIGYYLLLAAGLYYRNFITIVIALALCMMSRYSLAVWALMFVAYVYYYHTKSRALTLTLYSAGVALFLLVLSRGILQIDVFASLSGDYLRDIKMPEHKWKFMPTVNSSLGLAKFFRYEELPILHNIFFIFTLATPLACLLVYHKFRDLINKRFFNLASLKICLVLFYNLLIIPYQYLFYTSTFLSIAILYFYIIEDTSVS